SRGPRPTARSSTTAARTSPPTRFRAASTTSRRSSAPPPASSPAARSATASEDGPRTLETRELAGRGKSEYPDRTRSPSPSRPGGPPNDPRRPPSRARGPRHAAGARLLLRRARLPRGDGGGDPVGDRGDGRRLRGGRRRLQGVPGAQGQLGDRALRVPRGREGRDAPAGEPPRHHPPGARDRRLPEGLRPPRRPRRSRHHRADGGETPL